MYIEKYKYADRLPKLDTNQYEGKTYDSIAEACYAAYLDKLIEEGELIKWEAQVRIELKVNGYWIGNYFIDFKLYHTDGEVSYTEVKGLKSSEWLMKWRLFEALYSKDHHIEVVRA